MGYLFLPSVTRVSIRLASLDVCENVRASLAVIDSLNGLCFKQLMAVLHMSTSLTFAFSVSFGWVGFSFMNCISASGLCDDICIRARLFTYYVRLFFSVSLLKKDESCFKRIYDDLERL